MPCRWIMQCPFIIASPIALLLCSVSSVVPFCHKCTTVFSCKCFVSPPTLSAKDCRLTCLSFSWPFLATSPSAALLASLFAVIIMPTCSATSTSRSPSVAAFTAVISFASAHETVTIVCVLDQLFKQCDSAGASGCTSAHRPVRLTAHWADQHHSQGMCQVSCEYFELSPSDVYLRNSFTLY